jgi:hypothetical protein
LKGSRSPFKSRVNLQEVAGRVILFLETLGFLLSQESNNTISASVMKFFIRAKDKKGSKREPLILIYFRTS